MAMVRIGETTRRRRPTVQETRVRQEPPPENGDRNGGFPARRRLAKYVCGRDRRLRA
jgi:hypothetical protein